MNRRQEEVVATTNSVQPKLELTELFSRHIIPGHVQILENVYMNYNVVTYSQLWNVFKNHTNISDKTFRKRIKELDSYGLIKCIKSYELLIYPKKEIRADIIQEIQNYRTKLMLQ